MQSVDEFTPSTTEPVFGSGLISQTKSQTSTTTNDNNENEKTNSTSESVVNGQEETTKVDSNENITNGTKKPVSENNDAMDSSIAHVNGENEKQINESTKEKELVSTSETETVVAQAEPDPKVTSTESEPISSTIKESSSSVNNEPVSVPVDTDETPAVKDVPETPVATESEVVEPKSKSSRGKAKIPVASAAPTRHSTRARKPVTIIEENEISDVVSTTNQNEPSKRTKRQAATIAKDAITASNQPNSTSGSSTADDGNDQDEIPSDAGDDDDEINEGKTKKSSPSTRKKRGASVTTAAANAAKKAKGKNSVNVDNSAATNQGETIETPTKKARTTAVKKGPEPPSEEYVRKLRPRK